MIWHGLSRYGAYIYVYDEIDTEHTCTVYFYCIDAAPVMEPEASNVSTVRELATLVEL